MRIGKQRGEAHIELFVSPYGHRAEGPCLHLSRAQLRQIIDKLTELEQGMRK